MNFREFVNTTELPGVEAFFTRIKQMVLSSANQGQGNLAFKFPDNYDAIMQQVSGTQQRQQGPATLQFPQQSAPLAQQQPQLVAAWFTPSGVPVREGWEKEDPHGKGGVAYKAIAGKLPAWNKQDVEQFKSGLNKNITRIGKQMGLLFEIECFFWLLNNGLREIETHTAGDLAAIKVLHSTHQSVVIDYTGDDLSKQIFKFIQVHADSMSESMLNLANRYLRKNFKVTADEVEFLGGEEKSVKSRKDPADIRLWNSTMSKGVGMSLKFGSETKMGVASMGAMQAYKLFGGKDVQSVRTQLQSARSSYKDTAQVMLGELSDLAGKYENNPVNFAKLASWLLTGGTKTYPAVRFYVRNKGEAGFSHALQSDFDIRGMRLAAKPNATVTKNVTGSYLQLTYKVKGGSTFGTSIFFEPTLATAYGKKPLPRVNVKMNNLASEGNQR